MSYFVVKNFWAHIVFCNDLLHIAIHSCRCLRAWGKGLPPSKNPTSLSLQSLQIVADIYFNLNSETSVRSKKAVY